jgi:hypothetical protein
MLKLQEKVAQLSDEKLKDVYTLASHVSMATIEDLCPDLLDICLNSAQGALKNELGMVIFHLQKNERISTRIGLQKLLHGALKVNAEATFKLLESSDSEAKQLSKKIKAVFYK